MLKCNACDTQSINTLQGWKRHRTQYHDGYTDEDLKQALKEAGASEGAAALGEKNFESASVSSPETDQPVEAPKRGRKPKIEQEQLQARLEFSRAMAKEICDSITRDPYDIMAWLLDQPSLSLTDAEAEPISAAWQRLCEIFGFEFASKWWAIIIVIRANSHAIHSRMPTIMAALEQRLEPTPTESVQ